MVIIQMVHIDDGVFWTFWYSGNNEDDSDDYGDNDNDYNADVWVSQKSPS